MSRPTLHLDKKSYRKEYNSRPEVRERQKIHTKKYKNKPEVKLKLREYNREYMKEYWKKNPDKYEQQKLRIAELNRARTEARKEFQNTV